MSNRPTLQDVADAVGLAPATVSYALRGERGSEATIARVAEAAARLGYQADPIARALASGRSHTVAVLCGSTRDLWQQSLATDLARALMAHGRQALIADADGDLDREQSLLATLRDQRPDGLLVAPLDPFAGWWEQVAAEMPLVSVGNRLADAPSAGAVVFDNPRGFALVFDHLVALGHRRIAVVLPEQPSTPDRPAAALIAREAERCRIEASLIPTPPATADTDAMTQHLARALAEAQPTAAFCLSDSFAFATLRAASRLGLTVPGDLSVVGFENLEFADLAGPGLTTVNWGRGQLVQAAVAQLIARSDEDAPPATTTIAPRLVPRGSTGPAPAL